MNSNDVVFKINHIYSTWVAGTYVVPELDILINHLLFLHSDDIIRFLEQNGRLLNKSTISLELTKSLR